MERSIEIRKIMREMTLWGWFFPTSLGCFQLQTFQLKTFQLLVFSNCPFQLHVSQLHWWHSELKSIQVHLYFGKLEHQKLKLFISSILSIIAGRIRASDRLWVRYQKKLSWTLFRIMRPFNLAYIQLCVQLTLSYRFTDGMFHLELEVQVLNIWTAGQSTGCTSKFYVL